MFRTIIIFCAYFAPLIQSFETSNQTTDNSVTSTFSTSDDETNYVTSIKPEVNKVGSITEMTIKTKINGIYEKYVLQSVEGYFAGEETKVWLAKPRLGEKYLVLDYTLQENIMKQVNISFYQDSKTQSSVSHLVNEEGDSEFIGVINSNTIITPLKNYTEDLTKKGSITIEDYIISKFLNKTWYTMKESTLGMPDIVYPEILVFVDNSIFKQFNMDVKNTVAYILTLFNGVDLLFRTMKTPKIRLSIAGIVILQTETDLPFNVSFTLKERFNKFMYSEKQFKFRQDYDIAVLIGGSPKDYIKRNVNGLATIGGACTDFITFQEIQSTVVAVDDTAFSGIVTVTHELAHLFGSEHDGIEGSAYIGGPNVGSCFNDDDNLMKDSDKYNSQKFYFSKCSQERMSFFFSREDANCLRNNPAVGRTDKQMLRILPGKLMSLSEQCQKLGFDDAFVVRDNICSKISCTNETKKDQHDINKLSRIAPEGTACAPNKYCIRGDCVPVINENNLDLQLFFPPPF